VYTNVVIIESPFQNNFFLQDPKKCLDILTRIDTLDLAPDILERNVAFVQSVKKVSNNRWKKCFFVSRHF